MAANAPLTFHQGDDVFYDFVVVGADEVTPIDLIGATITSSIKQNYNKPVIENFTVTETDLSNGQFQLSLTSEQTAALPFSGTVSCKKDKVSFVYDVQMIQQNGQTITLMRGKIVVTRDVTT